MDELTRLRWTCTILEYVRREGHWGLRDVDVLRCLLGGSSDGWLLAMEPDLHRWYGEALDVPRDALGP